MATPLLRALILKVVERCNLNCSYCYMYNYADQQYVLRPHFMSPNVFQGTMRRVQEYCDARPGHSIKIVFHGGEPMLFDPLEFEKLLIQSESIVNNRIELFMQTNATLVSDAWIRVLHKFRINTSVSLDGPPEVHDEFRIDHRGEGSYARTVAGLHSMIDAELNPGVLCVINPFRSGLDCYRHFRAIGLRTMNFLFPDISHDFVVAKYGSREGTPIADYLIPIFDEWMREDDPSVQIRLFVEAIKVLHGAESSTDALGSQLEDYLVIDTDGSILANDALKACFDGAPEFGLNVMEHSFDDLIKGSSFLYALTRQGTELCEQCTACREKVTCGGGHLPNRFSSTNGFRNPSVWCSDLLKLFDHIRTELKSKCGCALCESTSQVAS
jgi:uncharacterized protein